MKKLNLGNIGTKEKIELASEVLETIDLDFFPVSKIELSENIRKDYSEIECLANSIKQDGQLQPIGISKQSVNGKHKLIYGFRRFQAIKHLRQETVKVIFVVEYENLETVQLIENIQREDLSDYEIAKTLKTLKDQTKETNIQLAKRLSKTEIWVRDKLSHLEIVKGMLTYLPEKDQETLKEIPSSIVNETRGLEEKDQKTFIEKVVKIKKEKGRLPTQKQIRETAKKAKANKQTPRERILKLKEENKKLEKEIKVLNIRIQANIKEIEKLKK